MSDYSGIKYDGQQEYNLKYLGAYHMIGEDGIHADDYEPQRVNNFEVHLYGFQDLLRTVDAGIKIPANIAEDCLTLSAVSVGALNTNVGVIQVPYGNTKVKFAGVPDISDVEIVYNDYIGKSTERVIAAWHALVFNPKTEKIGRASVYKRNGLLIETAPDGERARVWQLYGCWPSNVSYGGYDYNSGGSVRQINLTLTIDRMIPLDA